MVPLKVGLVGCGRLAERGWIPALKLGAAAGTAELVALAEPDSARREAAARAAGIQSDGAFADWRDLIASGRADALVLALGGHAQVEPATAATAAGLRVLVEKPPGGDLCGSAGARRPQPGPRRRLQPPLRPRLERPARRRPAGLPAIRAGAAPLLPAQRMGPARGRRRRAGGPRQPCDRPRRVDRRSACGAGALPVARAAGGRRRARVGRRDRHGPLHGRPGEQLRGAGAARRQRRRRAPRRLLAQRPQPLRRRAGRRRAPALPARRAGGSCARHGEDLATAEDGVRCHAALEALRASAAAGGVWVEVE